MSDNLPTGFHSDEREHHQRCPFVCEHQGWAFDEDAALGSFMQIAADVSWYKTGMLKETWERYILHIQQRLDRAASYVECPEGHTHPLPQSARGFANCGGFG